ncbi:ArnT family glycosyltransferase [Parerythrobacter jejuensis]|uniref:Glycosyltransferase RgtA/B/C/D-like domain-containing protein n=1 Tax=Parerythrobacter jejuensis TaxID=795812 RepID=A0A845AW69_9SPHN|nr:glycosyltransferase family 39 protein [Parerythrobacter jejuensis]MXP30653.1 hypothetical protein [Parerythrobacter jejuensis]MXP33413.1 hypothetical protein [Parerythrobacter jejuensis]
MRGRSSFAITLAGIGVLAFAIRFALRAARGSAEFEASGYTLFLTLAKHLAAGSGYTLDGSIPTAFRVPLYPLFLAATGGTQGNFWTIALAQSLVSAGSVVLTGVIGRRLFSPQCGVLAASMALLWPYAAAHDTALQESGLFAALTMLSVWLLVELHQRQGIVTAIAVGIALGLAILTRATLLPFALFAIAWAIIPAASGSHPLGRRLRSSAIVTASLGLTLLPWLVYSQDVAGKPSLGTEAATAIYAGNHELTFSHYPIGSIDASRRVVFQDTLRVHGEAIKVMSSAELGQWFEDRAWAAVTQDPGRTVSYAGAKLWAAFGPQKVPREPRLFNAIYVVSWTPVFLLGLAGLWLARRDWRRGVLFWALIGSFAAVTALIWSQTSHKSYLDYTFIIFGAYAISHALSSERARRVLARMPHPVQRIIRRNLIPHLQDNN